MSAVRPARPTPQQRPSIRSTSVEREILRRRGPVHREASPVHTAAVLARSVATHSVHTVMRVMTG